MADSRQQHAGVGYERFPLDEYGDHEKRKMEGGYLSPWLSPSTGGLANRGGGYMFTPCAGQSTTHYLAGQSTTLLPYDVSRRRYLQGVRASRPRITWRASRPRCYLAGQSTTLLPGGPVDHAVTSRQQSASLPAPHSQMGRLVKMKKDSAGAKGEKGSPTRRGASPSRRGRGGGQY